MSVWATDAASADFSSTDWLSASVSVPLTFSFSVSVMFDEARVYLNDGFVFGPEGDGFVRVNLACPRAVLVGALERIKNAARIQNANGVCRFRMD